MCFFRNTIFEKYHIISKSKPNYASGITVCQQANRQKIQINLNIMNSYCHNKIKDNVLFYEKKVFI